MVAICVGVVGAFSVIAPARPAGKRAILTAARAPFVALANKDARALCGAFTRSAASHMAREGTVNGDCAARVSGVFAAAEPVDQSHMRTLVRAIKVTRVRRYGRQASALIRYGSQGRGFPLTLVWSSGRWLIATLPMLNTASGCRGRPGAAGCPPGAKVIVFGFIESLSTGPLPIAPPTAIKRAGGSELREFKAGARVAARSGCLACHRIGAQGNARPGPALTHVGAQLSEAQIKKVLLDPAAPMPSFKNLPRAKLRTLMRFLELLR